VLEVKSRRVGGATYQVPVEVRPRRATTLAIRWIVGYSRQRREKTMAGRLAAELLDASNGLGAAVKRRGGLAEDGGVEPGLRALPLVNRVRGVAGIRPVARTVVCSPAARKPQLAWWTDTGAGPDCRATTERERP
jgi:hypothetical protein